METATTKDPRMSSFLALYDLHTPFFGSVLDGISDEAAHNRMGTEANHIAWIAGSLVQQRYEMANMLTGSSHKQGADELFRDNKGIQENVSYPPLSQYRQEWEKIAPIAREALVNATTQKLSENFEMPGMTFTYYELVSFSIYREANCIGQIALWRRILGYPPMKYM